MQYQTKSVNLLGQFLHDSHLAYTRRHRIARKMALVYRALRQQPDSRDIIVYLNNRI